MKKEKIGIDLDDVVFDFVKELLVSLELKYNKRLLFENVTNYFFPSIFNLDLEQVLELIKNLDYINLGLCKNAKNSILELSQKYDIYFITSRVFRDGTLESLKKNFNDIPFELIFSSNPYANTLGKDKGDLCLELGINLMVEDSKEHSEICAKKGVKVFLLDKPWNKDVEEHENLVKVGGWDEILEKLNLYKIENVIK